MRRNGIRAVMPRDIAAGQQMGKIKPVRDAIEMNSI
jgi:hypothetical protein